MSYIPESPATGRQKTTALLTLASIAGAKHSGPNTHQQQQQQYTNWLWHLLLSPAGKSLVQLDTAEVPAYVALCKAEVNAACRPALIM